MNLIYLFSISLLTELTSILFETPPDIFIEYNRYEQNDNLFLIFIHPSQPIIKKYFFKKIDLSTQLSHVSETLQNTLSDATIFHNVERERYKKKYNKSSSKSLNIHT